MRPTRVLFALGALGALGLVGCATGGTTMLSGSAPEVAKPPESVELLLEPPQ